MSLTKFVIRRILVSLVVLFIALTISFILVKSMPGNPYLAHERNLSGAALEAYNARAEAMGWNDPVLVQYWKYLVSIMKGDWGESIIVARGVDVWDLIWAKFPITLELAIFSTLFASIIGIKTGVLSAIHRNKPKDTMIRLISLLGVSIPVFWMGMLLQYVFGYLLNIFPTIGFKTTYLGDPTPITYMRMIDCLLNGEFLLFIDTVWHMILPLFVLTFFTLASITRQTRSSMLEVMEMDYIRTARAKGCKEKDVINKHALRNALIPTVTVIGMNFGGIMAGAVLTETTFNLRGFGMLLIQAVSNLDYFVVTALVFLITFFVVLANLITDILYAFLDPRIRY